MDSPHRAEKSFKSTLTGTLSKLEKFLNIPLGCFKTARIMESNSQVDILISILLTILHKDTT